MLRQNIHPLWEIDPWLYVAGDANEKPILTASTKEEAEMKAELETGKRPCFVVQGWFVRRPILDATNLIAPAIVLFGEKKWQDGKLFIVKEWKSLPSPYPKEISLQGFYLEELLEYPSVLLCKRLTNIKVNTEVDLKWEPRAWAPVMTELDLYIHKIRNFCEMDIFSSSLPNAKALNKQVRDEFQHLLAFTKTGFPKPTKK